MLELSHVVSLSYYLMICGGFTWLWPLHGLSILALIYDGTNCFKIVSVYVGVSIELMVIDFSAGAR